jgi:hypothetical protein
MSKRFAIIAAALVSAGRSLSTTSVDHSDPFPFPLDRQTKRIRELAIEERSRLANAELEQGPPGEGPANISVQPMFFSAL